MRMEEIIHFERQEAREEGRKEGQEDGRKQGRIEGVDHLLEELIIKKLAKGTPECDLPELLEQTPETINRILEKIKKENAVIV